MYEFITVTVPEGSLRPRADSTSRHAIRKQAMLQYRMRQREQKGLRNTLESANPSAALETRAWNQSGDNDEPADLFIAPRLTLSKVRQNNETTPMTRDDFIRSLEEGARSHGSLSTNLCRHLGNVPVYFANGQDFTALSPWFWRSGPRAYEMRNKFDGPPLLRILWEAALKGDVLAADQICIRAISFKAIRTSSQFPVSLWSCKHNMLQRIRTSLAEGVALLSPNVLMAIIFLVWVETGEGNVETALLHHRAVCRLLELYRQQSRRSREYSSRDTHVSFTAAACAASRAGRYLPRQIGIFTFFAHSSTFRQFLTFDLGKPEQDGIARRAIRNADQVPDTLAVNNEEIVRLFIAAHSFGNYMSMVLRGQIEYQPFLNWDLELHVASIYSRLESTSDISNTSLLLIITAIDASTWISTCWGSIPVLLSRTTFMINAISNDVVVADLSASWSVCGGQLHSLLWVLSCFLALLLGHCGEQESVLLNYLRAFKQVCRESGIRTIRQFEETLKEWPLAVHPALATPQQIWDEATSREA